MPRKSRSNQPTAPRSICTDLRERRYRPSFDELFDRLWSNFGAFGHSKAEHPENLTVEILLSSEEARRGGSVRIALPVRQVCPACGGRGWIGPFDCMQCRGTGVLKGEYSIEVAYPSGIPDSHITQLSLDAIGIHNLYLTVYFRVHD